MSGREPVTGRLAIRAQPWGAQGLCRLSVSRVGSRRSGDRETTYRRVRGFNACTLLFAPTKPADVPGPSQREGERIARAMRSHEQPDMGRPSMGVRSDLRLAGGCTPAGRCEMQAIRIGVIGGFASVAAFALSRLNDGMLGAVGYMLALFIPLVTLGAVAALAVDAWNGRLEARRDFDSDDTAVRRSRSLLSRRVCKSCSARMTQIHSLWVCDRCDRVVVRS